MADRRRSAGQREGLERRHHKRKKTCIAATMINPESDHSAACIIRNADEKGCQLYSSYLEDFPDAIFLHPKGLQAPVMARIAWKNGNMAGVQFDFDIKPDLLVEE